MRIVSQDDMYDLPYDKCVIWISDRKVIKVSPIGEPEPNYTFAKYSTQEKAERAIQLLREAYSGMPIICNISESEYEEKKFKEILKIPSIISVSIPNEISKVEYVNRMIF